MHARGFAILLLFAFHVSRGFTQRYLENEDFYNRSAVKYFMQNDSLSTFRQAHLSMKPLAENRVAYDSIFHRDGKYYYWITQKLFKEHFLVFEGKDYWCAIDPIIDLVGGRDFYSDSSQLLYWNTRGIRVQGKFFDNFSFSTAFYENQALVPEYVSNYIDQFGELRPKNNGGYLQEHAVMPGYARTKPFKVDGYDFAFGQGNIAYQPSQHFNVQFGNGNLFVGNGHRSLLLSDFCINYPFLRLETNLWQDRIQYSTTYALHQNLIRIPFYESVEPTYERKIGTYHYLDFAITPRLTVGLFQGALWKRSDSTGTHEPNWLFLNPIPFVNGIIQGENQSDYNHIFGLNAAYTLENNQLYAQILIDNNQLGALQIGLKSYEQLLRGLDIQIEYNWATNGTYSANNHRYNYTHSNLPLAHPLGSGFNEGIIKLNYEKNNWFISNKTVYFQQFLNDSLPDGTNLLFSEVNAITPTNTQRHTLLNNLEMGYRFNKSYNLQAVIGWLFREDYYQNIHQNTSYVYAGIRTRLKNKNLDF